MAETQRQKTAKRRAAARKRSATAAVSRQPSGPHPQPVVPGKDIRIMVYGLPGVGKTPLAGSAPKTLLIRPPTDHPDAIEHPEYCEELVVHNHAQLDETFQWLQQMSEVPYDWVWWDNVSIWQDHGLDDIWQDVLAVKPAREAHGLDQGEYGVNMHRISQFVRNMVGLTGFHFGITAHPFEGWDPVNETELWMPYIQGKEMSRKIQGYMKVVGYLREQPNGKRVLHTRRWSSKRDQHFDAKDQLGVGGSKGYMISPTVPKIVAAVAAHKKKGGTGRTTTKRTTRRKKG